MARGVSPWILTPLAFPSPTTTRRGRCPKVIDFKRGICNGAALLGDEAPLARLWIKRNEKPSGVRVVRPMVAHTQVIQELPQDFVGNFCVLQPIHGTAMLSE